MLNGILMLYFISSEQECQLIQLIFQLIQYVTRYQVLLGNFSQINHKKYK